MEARFRVKNALDRLAAGVLLVLVGPFLAILALAIRIDSHGGALFAQERVGAGGRTFTIFKFRTMRLATESEGLGITTAADDARITRLGRLLRATSLDELPQLLNIVRGEMSFVGPRPTLGCQVERYTPRQAQRLRMRPGITGWAQVNGRNEIPWEHRIELDLEYLERWSFGFDARILLRTLAVLWRREGVYAQGAANDAFGAPAEPSAGQDEAAPTAPGGGVPEDPGARLPLLVVGAGGHARVLVDIAERQGRYQVVGLLDERPELAGTTLLGYPVLGGRERLADPALPAHAIVAIGDPDARAAWQGHLEARGFHLAVLVHPSAVVGREVEIGPGSVLMAAAVVNPATRLGRGVIVNTAASVDHDCDVGDFVHVAPGARLAGGVRVGARAHVGIGACVLQNRVVGSRAVVGGGAVVVHPVPDGVTVVGVPARPLGAHRPARVPARA